MKPVSVVEVYTTKSCWLTSLANTVGDSGVSHNTMKILHFFPLLSLETALPALRLTENCYLNMSISFSWKMAI